MKCVVCKRPISAGADALKMVVEYIQADGSVKLFGYMMADGPLTTATGQLLHAFHWKCLHIVRKREARGDAVTGRAALGGVPTGYDISAAVLTRDEFEALGISMDEARDRTAGLTARVTLLREVARRIGKGVGDATVLEAFWADEHSGPYPHSHHLRLEVYQLRAHLLYAHGYDFTTATRAGVHIIHDELHAKAAAVHTAAVRAADAGHTDTAERDWRPHVAVDIDDIITKAE